MFLLLIITCLIPNITPKVYNLNEQDNNNADELNERKYFSIGHMQYIAGDPLWVLALNRDEWLDSKLSLATFEQEVDFYNAAGSGAKIYQSKYRHPPPALDPIYNKGGTHRRAPTAKKNDPGKPKTVRQSETRSNEDLIKDIMKFINKFALTANEEPDVYLTERDGTNPTIVLYFKGSICCLKVTAEEKEWIYVLNNYPFPAWFYDRHDTFEAPLKIPTDITNPFYSALLRLLKLVLYIPL